MVTTARRREPPAEGIAAPIAPADVERLAAGEPDEPIHFAGPPAGGWTLYAPRQNEPYLPDVAALEALDVEPRTWLDRPGLRALVTMLLLLGLLAAFVLVGEDPLRAGR